MASPGSHEILHDDAQRPEDEHAILEAIGEVGLEVLERYSHIPQERIIAHVDKIRCKGWAIMPYPCFAKLSFLNFDLLPFRRYPEILERLQQDEKFLDVGCGLGQHIRFLAYQGVPKENLLGVDISRPFIDLGYELFCDQATLNANFILSDLLEPGPELNCVWGTISIIYAGLFLHLWDWARQLKVAKHLVNLLKPQKGVIVAGTQVGSHTQPGNWFNRPNPEYGPMFVQSPTTMEELWKQVGLETASNWKLTAYMSEDTTWKPSHGDGEDRKPIVWVAERL